MWHRLKVSNQSWAERKWQPMMFLTYSLSVVVCMTTTHLFSQWSIPRLLVCTCTRHELSWQLIWPFWWLETILCVLQQLCWKWLLIFNRILFHTGACSRKTRTSQHFLMFSSKEDDIKNIMPLNRTFVDQYAWPLHVAVPFKQNDNIQDA